MKIAKQYQATREEQEEKVGKESSATQSRSNLQNREISIRTTADALAIQKVTKSQNENDPLMLRSNGHVTLDFHVEEDPLVTCASDAL